VLILRGRLIQYTGHEQWQNWVSDEKDTMQPIAETRDRPGIDLQNVNT